MMSYCYCKCPFDGDFFPPGCSMSSEYDMSLILHLSYLCLGPKIIDDHMTVPEIKHKMRKWTLSITSKRSVNTVGRNRMIVKFLNRTSSWSSLFLQFKNRDLWTMSERRKGEVQGAHKLDYSQTHSFQGPNLIGLMSFNASHRYKASLPCHYRDIMSRLRNLE